MKSLEYTFLALVAIVVSGVLTMAVFAIPDIRRYRVLKRM